jgi:probable O-glycosylation ligase (exosortase A-associated)
MYIASATLLGFLLQKNERNYLPRERETFILLILWGLFVISSLTSLVPTMSMDELSRTSKVLLMTFVTLFLSCTRERLRYLFWIIALSMGGIGIKAGVFGIATGGGLKVWGPPDTFISDNNDVGLAFNIALPIIYYLATYEKLRYVRNTMLGVFFLTVLSTVLTFSRGSAVTLALLLFLIAMVSKNKIRNIILMCVLGLFLSFFITDKLTERMSTIDDAKEDASFMGRVNAWHSAWNMAIDRPITGGGLAATQSKELFARYAPDPENFHASHNIFFQMLGENGFTGLTLFVLLLGSLFISLNHIRRNFALDIGHKWLSQYAFTIQLSLVAFTVNGLTLGRAYFDLSFLVIAMGIMVKSLANDVLRERVINQLKVGSEVEKICAA